MFKIYQRECALLIAILCLCLVPLFGSGGFYTWATWSGLCLDNIPVLIAALGMTLIIISAEIDISIAAQLAICGVVAAHASLAGLPLPMCFLLAMLCGACLGGINALLIVYARIPSIIATLATWVIFEQSLLLITQGAWVQGLSAQWQWMGMSQDAALYVFLVLCLVLVLLMMAVLRYTRFGRACYAVGCDHESAQRVGISVPWTLAIVFIVMGALMGLASMCNYLRYPSIETGGGQGLELKVIAAVVIGGCLITGGRGSVIGSILGVVLLGLIGTVLNFMNIDATWERAIQGAIILLAVCMDRIRIPRAVHG